MQTILIAVIFQDRKNLSILCNEILNNRYKILPHLGFRCDLQGIFQKVLSGSTAPDLLFLQGESPV